MVVSLAKHLKLFEVVLDTLPDDICFTFSLLSLNRQA